MNNTPQTSGTLRTKKDLHVIGILVAGILLCAFAALIAFPQLTQSVRVAASAKALARIFPTGMYVSDSQTQSYVRTASESGYVQVPFEGLLVSAAHTTSGPLYVVRDAQGVFDIRLGERSLVKSTFVVASADLSPDGKYVVYTIQTQATKPLELAGRIMPFVTLMTNDWTVVAHEIQSGRNIFLGAGVHPFFVDNTHIVKVAPAGIYKVDITTLAIVELMAIPAPAVYLAPLISSDRTKVAISQPDTKHITVYSIEAEKAVPLVTVPFLDNVQSYALSNTALYALKSSAMGSDIISIPLTSPVSPLFISRIPVEMGIGRIIP